MSKKQPRPADTYRGARRNDFHEAVHKQMIGSTDWPKFNIPGRFMVGSRLDGYNPNTTVTHRVVSAIAATGRRFLGGFGTRRPSNKVHFGNGGAKEHARHASKPDGLMHTPTAALRSNYFKRAQEAQPAPAKPKRTRAKKVAAA